MFHPTSSHHIFYLSLQKMMRLTCLALCVAAVFGAPSINTDLDEEWTAFKSIYDKKYEQAEEIRRRQIWENNLKTIRKHNLETDMGVYTYRLGVNEYADLTGDEFATQLKGFRMSESPSRGSSFLPPSNIDVPQTVDWRTKGYVTGVKNQGTCGSCYAFSSTGALEGQHFKKTGKLVSLSEQNIVDCSRKQGNKGCGGGIIDQCFTYINQNGGIDTEATYSYEGKVGKCRFRKTDVGATDTGFMDITPRKDEEALQMAVATVGPISVAIDANHTSIFLYKSGILNVPDCSQDNLDHAVLVVGYGSLNEQDYWLVKNSWGLSWGVKGYMKMSRNKNNQCGIASRASYPLV